MRAWLYDTLITDPSLVPLLGGVEGVPSRVIPRESQETFNIPKPFLIYGLGSDTNEDLADDDDHVAHRQFFQIWIHDEGGDFGLIDDMIPLVKAALHGKSHPPSMVTWVRWLETSSEFSNATYNTIFRYLRFQAIISKGAVLT